MKAIAINESWRLAPWADILYGCDARWWRRVNGAPDFQGVKVSQDVMALEKREWGVNLIRTDRSRSDILTDHPGRVGWGGTKGGNGGFHCCNLTVQLGVARLLLVGFDMRIDRGVHWHGPHQRGLDNPARSTVEKWRAHLDSLAGRFVELGVTVINCSDVSALTAYPKMDLQKALGLAPPESRAAA